jgi:hypothetical protein
MSGRRSIFATQLQASTFEGQGASVTDEVNALHLPAGLSSEHRSLLTALASRHEADHAEKLLGLVLSGSAGRGMATGRSDLDVFVIVSETGERRPETSRSATLDETLMAISDLEQVPQFGTAGWWYRWSFAWAPVLFDRTNGRLTSALHRQATVTADEAESILVEHDRLDGWLNYAYRALKNDRDGRPLECRLDAAESMPWLLDVIFTLEGRVRPYHKYLSWELQQHPLNLWHADELLAMLTATLDGDPSAVRATFEHIETACVAFDSDRPDPVLMPIIEGWGDELQLLRR